MHHVGAWRLSSSYYHVSVVTVTITPHNRSLALSLSRSPSGFICRCSLAVYRFYY